MSRRVFSIPSWALPLLALAGGILALAWLPLTSNGAGSPPPATAGPAHAATPSSSEEPSRPFLRGMTVTCPRHGEIWGSPAMGDALDQLRDLGVGSVAIHPYARIERDGTVRHRPAAGTGYLGRAASIARQHEMALFWKPHLAYWGNYEWRGEIGFGDDEAAWQRFFDTYRAFIVDQAAFAAQVGVPLFAVGVELEKTVHREAQWREVIAAVRQVYPGQITYAANWDGVENVPFWDAVDVLGVQAYFPLADGPLADGPLADGPLSDGSPSAGSLDGRDSASRELRSKLQLKLESSWDRHLAQLETLSRDHGGLPVLFTEIGYNRSSKAAWEPWSYQVENNSQTRILRVQLMETALRRAQRAPFVSGLFWWKWMPGHSAGRSNFSMRDAEARDVLRRHWATTTAR
ncbi:MAG: hypothetical protein SX243_03130 [Acidobacteriota bacterium]|nr:hypothetical protein [Acidobacteriota bacterium]